MEPERRETGRAMGEGEQHHMLAQANSDSGPREAAAGIGGRRWRGFVRVGSDMGSHGIVAGAGRRAAGGTVKGGGAS